MARQHGPALAMAVAPVIGGEGQVLEKGGGDGKRRAMRRTDPGRCKAAAGDRQVREV